MREPLPKSGIKAVTDKDGILKAAIDAWEKDGIIEPEIARRLSGSLDTSRPSARSDTANYLLIIATGTALLSAAALFLDERLLEVFRKAFSIPHWVLATLLAGLSTACFWYVTRRKVPQAGGNEIRLLPGTLLALAALVYLCKSLARDAEYASPFLGLSAAMLMALAFIFRSPLVWTGGVLALLGWYGEWTGEISVDYRFLGMNYPLRFLPLAGVLGLLSAMLYRRKFSWPAAEITMHAAFITGVTAAWGLSVFGNYNHLEEWYGVRQGAVLLYGGIFALLGIASMLIGIRKEFRPARDYGLLAILLNLYTRFFEAFWDGMNKGLFFLILAITLYVIARWLGRKNISNKEETLLRH